MGHASRHLVNHPEHDGLDRRAAETTHHVAQDGAAAAPVNRHSLEGVGECDGISASGRGGLGNRHDVGHVGGQLGDDGETAGGADSAHNRLGLHRIDAEVDPARDVRARDIQFNRCQRGECAQALGHPQELLAVVPGNIGNDRSAQREQIREMLGQKDFKTVVVEPNAVQQARGGLHGARGLVAPARRLGDGLGDNATQLRERKERFHLAGVAKRP